MLAPSATLRVIHRHRIGRRPAFARVSELIYRGEQPIAVLTWLHDGEMRLPGVCVELDPALLRPGANRKLFFYAGVTSDPRYESPADLESVHAGRG